MRKASADQIYRRQIIFRVRVLKFEKQQPIISDLRSFIGLLYIFKINFYPEILGWNIPALKTIFCEMRLKANEKSRIQPDLKHHQLRDHPMRNQR